MQVQLHSFLTPAVSADRFKPLAALYPPHYKERMRGWVDPRITLDVAKSRLLLAPTGIRALDLPAGSSVAKPTTSFLLHMALFIQLFNIFHTFV